MATLTLEVDDAVLAEARATAQARGSSLERELLNKVRDLSSSKGASRQRRAVERLIERANAHPHVIEGGMPTREERNSR
jgi:hypothetical protein